MAQGIGVAAWRKELASAGESTLVFRDNVFVDDEAKTNLTAIQQQIGLTNVRGLETSLACLSLRFFSVAFCY